MPKAAATHSFLDPGGKQGLFISTPPLQCSTFSRRDHSLSHVWPSREQVGPFPLPHCTCYVSERSGFSIRPFTNPARQTHCFWTEKMSWRQQDGTIFPIEISSPKTTVFNSKQSQRTRTQTLCRNIKLLLIIFLQCFHAISVSSGLLDKITAGLLGD